MKINQLFREKPPESLVIKVLNAFGLKSFSDVSLFSKSEMMSKHFTLDALALLKPELERYYIPCKARIYLSTINCKTALTVFRQLLRLYAYKLEIKQKYIKYKKIIYYSVQPMSSDNGIVPVSGSHIRFDKNMFLIQF